MQYRVTTRLVVLAVLSLFFSESGYAAVEDIHILVAATPAALAEGVNVSTIANRFESNINDALQATGINSREVVVHPYPFPSTYVGDSVPGSGHSPILAWFGDPTNDPTLAQYRNTVVPFVNKGYDLVAIISASLTFPECGWANTPNNFSNPLNSENQFLMIIPNRTICISTLAP